MILAIDVGNTNLTGGVFDDEKLVLTFRRSTTSSNTSDELGLFLRNVLSLNNIDYYKIERIACCSVVPSINHSLINAFKKYFGKQALFISSGITTNLEFCYSNPRQIGADRIAAAIGAVKAAGDRNLIVIDMGTATTVDIVTKDKEFLGGSILSGVSMSVNSLASGTAQLPSVEVVHPESFYGTSTIEAMQCGVYYGHAGAIKELCSLYTQKIFGGDKPYIIGTGGFSSLFKDYGLFDCVIPDLVLRGLKTALELN